MLNILYLLTLFLFVDAGDNQTNLLRKLQPRTWNGSPANRSDFPFYVGLHMPNMQSTCGGTLISKYFVLTAAHCIVEINSDGSWQSTRQVVVYFGMSKYYSVDNDDPYNYKMTVNETGIIPHSLYDYYTFYNDIGLIELPNEATINPYVKLAYLPPINGNIDFIVGQQLFSCGWGSLGDNLKNTPTELQYIATQIVPDNDCINPSINWFNYDVNMCINALNRSICFGDSGGPNVIFAPKAILIGISSHGTIPSSADVNNFNITCEAGLPQVLTRVRYYLPWIQQYTGIAIH